jgi:hypothetical protein
VQLRGRSLRARSLADVPVQRSTKFEMFINLKNRKVIRNHRPVSAVIE